ncbi:MAG: hypothetical protein MI919_18740, partial [Holophagales bacterium]|nr:hypothetical protein [Holophagales bacterium]
AGAVRDLLRRFQSLPAYCRKLWRMIIDGRSYREMSGALGVAEGTLRVRVRRCRERALRRRDAEAAPPSAASSNEVPSPTVKGSGPIKGRAT